MDLVSVAHMEEEAVEEEAEEEHLLLPCPSCTLGGCWPEGAARELTPGKVAAVAQAKPLAQPRLSVRCPRPGTSRRR